MELLRRKQEVKRRAAIMTDCIFSAPIHKVWVEFFASLKPTLEEELIFESIQKTTAQLWLHRLTLRALLNALICDVRKTLKWSQVRAHPIRYYDQVDLNLYSSTLKNLATWYKNIGFESKNITGSPPFYCWLMHRILDTSATQPFLTVRGMNFGYELEYHRNLVGESHINILTEFDRPKPRANGNLIPLQSNFIAAGANSELCFKTCTYTYYPSQKPHSNEQRDKPKPEFVSLAEDAQRLGAFKVSRRDARKFALLTGDFNPIHWCKLYAKAFGFKSTILHGFAEAGILFNFIENIEAEKNRTLSYFAVRFLSPLNLPCTCGIFHNEGFYYLKNLEDLSRIIAVATINKKNQYTLF